MNLQRAIETVEDEITRLDKEQEQRIKEIGYVEEMNNPHQSEKLKLALSVLLEAVKVEELEE